VRLTLESNVPILDDQAAMGPIAGVVADGVKRVIWRACHRIQKLSFEGRCRRRQGTTDAA
jgi:hypothetical protein